MRFGSTFRPSLLFPEAGGPRPNTLLDELVVGHRSRPRPESTRKIQPSHSRKRSAGPAVQASSIQTPSSRVFVHDALPRALAPRRHRLSSLLFTSVNKMRHGAADADFLRAKIPFSHQQEFGF